MEIIFVLLIILVFVGLPLFQMRKQNQRMRQLREFQDSVQPGMVVKTTSGVHGRVANVGETTVDLEVARGIVTTWDKAAIFETVDAVDAGSAQAETLQHGQNETAADQAAPKNPFDDEHPFNEGETKSQ